MLASKAHLGEYTLFRFAKRIGADNIPAGWHDSWVCLWTEDECLRNDSSAEHLFDAVVRILGTMYDCVRVFHEDEALGVKRESASVATRLLGAVIAKYDGGDQILSLYDDGWVVCHSYDGDSLGRVVEITT